MRARDYHMWWKAIRIGLGHPLEADNYTEIVEKLSRAGVAVVIAIHMLPHESAGEKDYQIGDEQADRMERWSAALRLIGAERLAGFVMSSIGVDHVTRATNSISPEEPMQLLSQGMNIIDAWKAAACRYFDQFDIETHSELEALTDQFAEAHSEELSADIARFGDQRPTTRAAQRSFEADWSDAVDEKHDRQREEERIAKLEQQVERWDRDLRRAEKLLGADRTSDEAVSELVNRLVEAHREIAHRSDDQLGSQAREFRSNLAELIDRHRELFPTDVRPDAGEIRLRRMLSQIESLIIPEDAAWLAELGEPASTRDEMYDPVEFGSGDAVDETRRTVEVCFSRVTGVDWNWAVPNLQLIQGPVETPAVVGEDVRSAVNEIVQKADEFGQRLAAALLADFRERFLPFLAAGPLPLYKPDVTDDEVLNDVESASITIQWNPAIYDAPRVVFYFGVQWDPEHGICLEESSDGTFELSEL